MEGVWGLVQDRGHGGGMGPGTGQGAWGLVQDGGMEGVWGLVQDKGHGGGMGPGTGQGAWWGYGAWYRTGDMTPMVSLQQHFMLSQSL